MTATAPSAETTRKPWHGVIVATALPFTPDGEVDLDRYGEHVAWLAENGCHGVAPNGSLGEYQVLTPRGAHRRGADGDRRRARRLHGDAGCRGVRLARGPHLRRAGRRGRRARCSWRCRPTPTAVTSASVVEHFRELAKAGLPISAYNNPIDTKIDLTPGPAGRALPRGSDRGRQGVHGRVAAQLRDRGAGSRSRHPHRHRRLGARGRPGRREGLGRGLPQRLPACVRAALRGHARARHRDGAAAVPADAPADALGLQDRVRAGHQAVHGHRRALRRARAARRGSRCCREHEAVVRQLTEDAVAAGLD